MKGTKNQIRNEFEENLNGLRICDYITRDEQEDIMDSFDEWAEEAKNGDTYYYYGNEYTVEDEEDEEDEEDDEEDSDDSSQKSRMLNQ